MIIDQIIVPDYGFPRCYTSFEDFDNEFVDKRSNHEERPIAGHKRFPYDGATSGQCFAPNFGNVDGLNPPFISLGPHWSPIGLTQYHSSISGNGAVASNDCKSKHF